MQFKRRLKKDATIEIAPLIDIVFILLLFFVVTTTFKENPGLEIDLPETQDSKGIELRDLVVSIAPGEGDEPARIFFKGEEISEDDLEAELKREMELRADAESEDRFVVIEADKAVRFEVVHRIVTLAKQVGASGVNFPAVFQRNGDN